MLPRGELLLLPVAEAEGIALAGLIRKYGKRMDLADAGIVRLAEIFPKAKVITTDLEDFRTYRRNRNESLQLIHP
jgi:hypothetical protein